MVCLSRPYPFKFFKGCVPQILIVPFLNILSHLSLDVILTPRATNDGAKNRSNISKEDSFHGCTYVVRAIFIRY